MKLLCDTREQAMLEFTQVKDVEVLRQTLLIGDYTAWHRFNGREVPDPCVVERKGMGDLFTSFTSGYEREKAKWTKAHQLGFFPFITTGETGEQITSGYEREKAKWTKAHQLGLHYILAIEGTVTDVLQGNRYWKEGEAQESRKSGLAQLRQLCTISLKYQVQTWFFSSRKEMAFYLLEFFLASGRWLTSNKESQIQCPSNGS